MQAKEAAEALRRRLWRGIWGDGVSGEIGGVVVFVFDFLGKEWIIVARQRKRGTFCWRGKGRTCAGPEKVSFLQDLSVFASQGARFLCRLF